ncbi:MAG: fibronectin type III domain-containing protein [Chloroflexi bacterium]|nr:fibronectin type III domain-containing protein [Chloroflexota bacterium]
MNAIISRLLPIPALFAIIAALIAAGGTASAQPSPAAPQNVNVANGPYPGEVVFTWTEVAGVSTYRVGWLAVEDYQDYRDNDVWKQKFAYSDVIAASTYTVARLTPGIEYYFIVCRKAADDSLACSDWRTLLLDDHPLACPAYRTTGSVETDREALIALYNATDGSNWIINTNWLSDLPLNEWYGVITNATGE